MDAKAGVQEHVGAQRDRLVELSHRIHANPELGWEEEQAAGWLGVPLAVFALYGGLALLLEESHQRMVLPLGRRGRARSSLEGSFAHQVHQAEQEPGVRRQL